MVICVSRPSRPWGSRSSRSGRPSLSQNKLIRGRREDVNKVWCMLDDFKAMRKPYERK